MRKYTEIVNISTPGFIKPIIIYKDTKNNLEKKLQRGSIEYKLKLDFRISNLNGKFGLILTPCNLMLKHSI